MPKPFRVEALTGGHDLTPFTSGQGDLDRYLRNIARQDAKRRVTTVFVLVDNATEKVAGYYTLSSFSLLLSDLPAALQKRLPRYPEVPAVLLGRLARDLQFRGRGCGELLLLDALRRAWRATKQVAAYAVVVDAKDERAEAFYRRYGFENLPEHPNRLFLPMQTVALLTNREV